MSKMTILFVSIAIGFLGHRACVKLTSAPHVAAPTEVVGHVCKLGTSCR